MLFRDQPKGAFGAMFVVVSSPNRPLREEGTRAFNGGERTVSGPSVGASAPTIERARTVSNSQVS